jgi:hypothetical protein
MSALPQFISKINMSGFKLYKDMQTGSHLIRLDVPSNCKDAKIKALCITITPVRDQFRILMKINVIPKIDSVWEENIRRGDNTSDLEHFNRSLENMVALDDVNRSFTSPDIHNQQVKLELDDVVKTEEFQEDHPFYDMETAGKTSMVICGEDVNTLPPKLLPELAQSYVIPEEIIDLSRKVLSLAQKNHLNNLTPQALLALKRWGAEVSAIHPVDSGTKYKM